MPIRATDTPIVRLDETENGGILTGAAVFYVTHRET